VCSPKLDIKIVDSYTTFRSNNKTAFIINGDSAHLPLPDNSVDAIVTDPPYFDFVHYSELSDFFYAWLRLALQDSYQYFSQGDSRHPGEVQDRDPGKFSVQLGLVFSECFRVLKEQGLMVFSFHHSKPDAWLAIYHAITTAQFMIVASHPVKAEMSVSKTKAATSNPINLDAIIVCKKQPQQQPGKPLASEVWSTAYKRYHIYRERLRNAGRMLSNNDKYVILSSQILVYASCSRLNKPETQHLLERVYQLDFSHAEDLMNQGNREQSENFWKNQLITAQTHFAFFHE